MTYILNSLNYINAPQQLEDGSFQQSILIKVGIAEDKYNLTKAVPLKVPFAGNKTADEIKADIITFAENYIQENFK